MRISDAAISLFVCSMLMVSTGFEMNEFFPDERDALMQLRDMVNSSFNLHGNWTGPPCSKSNESRWGGIGCRDWHVSHLVLEGMQLTGSLLPTLLQNLTFLTKLSFRNNSLTGSLPDLAKLNHLEYVFLSRNHFAGSIPWGYIDLPKLTGLELQENHISGEIPPFNQQSLISFNVSNNNLQGQLPQTPVLQRFPESSYANNSDLCSNILGLTPCLVPGRAPAPSPSPVPSRKKNQRVLQLWTICLIAAAATIILLSLILILYLCYYRRIVYGRKSKQDPGQHPGEMYTERREKRSHLSGSPETSLELEFLEKPFFDLDDLLRAAAQVIGRGKLGTTYKAMLECGSVVAVKRFKETKDQLSKKEFVQQMHLLGSIPRNEKLTEIISFYHSKEEKLIIYEYVGDGSSLFNLLHENRGMGRMALGWNTRVSIIRDIAEGVELLHQCLANSQRVPHGNLKSSNILIDRSSSSCTSTSSSSSTQFRVKLTDYGLLPLVTADKLSIRETPEFGKKLTSKADVYCFGILVLEIVTGRIPTPQSSSSDLSGWVRAAVNNDWSTDILDVEILGEKQGYDDMLKLTEIGLECTHESPERRPKMTQVLTRIRELCPQSIINPF